MPLHRRHPGRDDRDHRGRCGSSLRSPSTRRASSTARGPMPTSVEFPLPVGFARARHVDRVRGRGRRRALRPAMGMGLDGLGPPQDRRRRRALQRDRAGPPGIRRRRVGMTRRAAAESRWRARRIRSRPDFLTRRSITWRSFVVDPPFMARLPRWSGIPRRAGVSRRRGVHGGAAFHGGGGHPHAAPAAMHGGGGHGGGGHGGGGHGNHH